MTIRADPEVGHGGGEVLQRLGLLGRLPSNLQQTGSVPQAPWVVCDELMGPRINPGREGCLLTLLVLDELVCVFGSSREFSWI